MTEIVPAIIASSFEELEDKIKQVEPYVSRVHIDIMDGIFVVARTIDGPQEVEKLDTELDLEVHLMVQKPENKIVRWLETRADKFLVHLESTSKIKEIADLVHDADAKIFAVLNPETDYQQISPHADMIDGVQVMSVHPGQYGADFVAESIKKIEDIHYFYPDLPIEVDGSINPKTAPKCIQAGATILAVGSHIFKSKNIEKAISELKNV